MHGPHDEKFYKFLSGLEEEYEALRKSGYSGEGFHSEGRRLGANVSHDVPPHIARQKALEAAEKRRKISVVLGGGGRLGGTTRSYKSPRELAAEVRVSWKHHTRSSSTDAPLEIGCRTQSTRREGLRLRRACACRGREGCPRERAGRRH